MPMDPRPAPLDRAVQAAKAVGHPARLRLLGMLQAGPLCVCQMTAVLGLAPSTVSAHLRDLRRAGLVAEEKRGRWVEYRLSADGPLAPLIANVLGLITDDHSTAADRDAVRLVTAVPVEVFCQTRSDHGEGHGQAHGKRYGQDHRQGRGQGGRQATRARS